MKIEVNKKPAEDPKYPCLMESEYGIVVLFTGKDCGVVLTSDKHFIGDYSHHWDMSIFKPFKGSVTLSND